MKDKICKHAVWASQCPYCREIKLGVSASDSNELLCVGFSSEQDNAIKVAVDKWPLDKTVKRASEELLELSLALLHYDRGRTTSTDNILEEMADVRIVLRHLEIKFGCYQKQLNEKVTKCDT